MSDWKNERMLTPFREIGLRFVETCQTCLAPCVKDMHTGSFITRANRVGVLACNNYELDREYVALVLQDSAGVLNSLPVEHAAQLHWIVCPHCGWKGWDEVWPRHCPKCAAEIMPAKCKAEGEVDDVP